MITKYSISAVIYIVKSIYVGMSPNPTYIWIVTMLLIYYYYSPCPFQICASYSILLVTKFRQNNKKRNLILHRLDNIRCRTHIILHWLTNNRCRNMTILHRLDLQNRCRSSPFYISYTIITDVEPS